MRSPPLFNAYWIIVIGVVIASLDVRVGFAQDPGTITGTVVDATSGQPIAGANVVIAGTARRAATNANGVFRISAAPGSYTLRIRFIGYQGVDRDVTVAAGQTTTADFQLVVTALRIDEVVVTGSRTVRSVLETAVPVDIISSRELRAASLTEVNQVLSVVAPSFNASHQTIADGSDHINPASLRGLGPDQVLVLVNGKRRHQSALVHVNGTFGRGTVGVDLNSIPTAAIERIEVLRDGAAAQYGSDAISGVVNIILKDQTDVIEVNTLAGITGEGDGEQVKADVNYGFRIGETGFFNVAGEFLDRQRTDRSETWTGPIFSSDGANDEAELAARGLTRDDFTMKTGQGNAAVGHLFFNSAVPLSENSEFYWFGGFSHRNGEATGFYRLPFQEERVVPTIYPNGFLPEIHTQISDRSIGAGIRGNTSGWDVDLSLTHGRNAFQYNIENTNNASLGSASPTTFDAGVLSFGQNTGNVDLVRLIDTRGAVNSLSLVLGGEFRVENYQIEAGEDASWQLGNGGSIPGVDFDTTSSGAPKNPGSQVFAGFQPDNEVDRFRNSISLYGGLETEISDQVLLDVGGRFENYSDFGSRVTGKIAARYEVVPEFAFRGAVSSGFRAPSLPQLWFNNVSIQFLIDPVSGGLEPSRVLTSNNQSQVTKAFGIPDLKEETSISVSAGFTANPIPNLSITADFYHIEIDDRIVLGSLFSDGDPIVATILAPFASLGVGAAQFFANAVDTKTNGVDLVVAYGTDVGRGQLSLTGSLNLTQTDVDTVNIPQSVADVFAGGDLDAVRDRLFNREERNRLEDALPRQKGTISARYTLDRFQLVGRANYYGSIEYKPTNEDNDETFGAKTLFDLDVSYEVVRGMRLSAGGNNIFNTFPDRQMNPANVSDGRFPYSRRVTQFGMNGGFYYGRLQLTL